MANTEDSWKELASKAESIGLKFRDALIRTMGVVGSEVADKTATARRILDGSIDPISGSPERAGPVDADLEVIETHRLDVTTDPDEG